MNRIFEDTNDMLRLVWAEGFLSVGPAEEQLLLANEGTYYYPPLPGSAIMGMVGSPLNALALFRITFPDRSFVGIGPDLPGIGEFESDPFAIH